MDHALRLAARGLGNVWPNPAVGCVILDAAGRVAGRGWTQPGGRPHAEVMALREAGERARGGTVFVTLEPCAHHGKTPPCAEALARAGVARVVSALTDPDPRVAGRGHAMLREAGIAVVEGVRAAEAHALNLGFLKRVTEGLPMVTLKLAASLDGRIATASGESQWITGPAARLRGHLLRATHDAVLVGGGTARADLPRLDVRGFGAVSQPVRVVMAAGRVPALPVTDAERTLVGIVGLRAVMKADPETPIRELMNDAVSARARESAEKAARRCSGERFIVLPIVDNEDRLVGILTFDDALRILEDADSEDTARQGGVEPLRRPYLSTPLKSLVRSRVLWLLVLAVGAALTVQVLEVFESTLEQVVALSLFVPLIIGTGGNTGNQAATTVTRALALGDVSPRDTFRVLWQEVRTGFTLGLILGVVAFCVAGLVYGVNFGIVIGLTLLSLCTVAASVGGIMPMLAKTLRADPAVFSNPFISTFVDATGLVVYFLIARAVLGL